MKILGGVIAPDGGTITIDGVEETSLSVSDSFRAGIAFVHQELNLFDNLDVAANIFIGREPRIGGPLQLVDTDKQRRMAAPLLKRLGADFSPATPVAALSLAQRQMVEIAKALSMNARLIILDEPTSSLPLSETAKLLEVIAALKAERHQRHLHFASPQRDRRGRRSRHRPARRQRWRAHSKRARSPTSAWSS